MNETEPELEELKMFENMKVGRIRPTKDINVLKKLNLSHMHTPDIVKTNVRKNDSLNIKELDRIEWANNMFFEYVSEQSIFYYWTGKLAEHSLLLEECTFADTHREQTKNIFFFAFCFVERIKK